MPSPLGHALAGLTVHALTARDSAELQDPRRAAVVSVAAMAPDLDLLWRFVDGRNHHQQQSHGIGAAILAGLVVWAVARLARRGRAPALGMAAAAAWLSHIATDYLGVDTEPPIGLMALWPLSSDYYHCPWSLFLDIGRTLEWVTLRHDSAAVVWEAVILLPPLVAAWRRRMRS